MDDIIKQKREYEIQKLNEKEAFKRYDLIDIGHGFIIRDRLSHLKHEYENCDYMLIPKWIGMDDNGVDKGYLDEKDFINLLNELDRQVNHTLYETSNHDLILSKKLIHDCLNQKLDYVLDNLITNEKFNISYCDTSKDNWRIIDIGVNVYQRGLEDIAYQKHEFANNPIFQTVFTTINNYESELEKQEKYQEIDTLIELKKRLLMQLDSKNIIEGVFGWSIK